jgi:hypothetical protein
MAEAAIVNIASARIATLSVTIRALTINNKQVTLALFRQLPKRWPYVFLDNERAIRFDYSEDCYWGYIRDKEREHLLWQDQGRLYVCAPHQRQESGYSYTDINGNYVADYSYYYWNNWREDWNLVTLPQLFIAV